MNEKDEIKARIDIVDLVSESVKLRRTGKNYIGFCPFHANSRTPAFVVFPETGVWRCFGECNEGGDIFKFVMKKNNWDFGEALRSLAERAGVQLQPRTPQKQEQEDQYDRLRSFMEDAVTFFHNQLHQSPAGKEALAFLKRRGLTAETMERFGLGYAPDSWQALTGYLTGKGASAADLVTAGLASEKQSGDGIHDRFRNRVMIPIRDMQGRMAGFGARILNPNDVPKFLNSPQTPLFDKGRLLYGLDQAKKDIRGLDQVVIVEGYLDVIILHQAGYANTVSPMGTALTEDQIRLLKRFTRRMVLALDADAAGEKATMRGLEVARQAMDRTDEMVFDARGLVRHEVRLQADLRVCTLPPGMDPDEVVLRNREEWGQILLTAKPIVEHVMETLVTGRDMDDPKEKTAVAAQVLPLIEDVPEAIERETYRQKLARLLRVDERALMGNQRPMPPSRTARRNAESVAPRAERKPPAQATPAQRARQMEAHILRLLLRDPEHIYGLNLSLQKAGLARISEQDFQYADHQAVARVILAGMEQDQLDEFHYVIKNTPDDLLELLNVLMAPFPPPEPQADQLVEDLNRTFCHLRLMRVEEMMEQIRFLQMDVQEQSEQGLNPYVQMFSQYTQIRAALHKALKAAM